MKPALLALLFTGGAWAQALPVVPFRLDPEQVLRSLRDRRPVMSESECGALALSGCRSEEPTRIRGISLRWVQLDTDEQLEAILVLTGEAEDSHIAYVFDRQAQWNLIGSFECRRHRCELDRMVRVQQLTKDAPPLLFCYRDRGGSGTVNWYNESFHLRAGRLWPSFQVITYEYMPFRGPYSLVRRVRASDDRLVIHTIREQPPGTKPQHSCEVLRWDAERFTYRPVAAEQAKYCDSRNGQPLADKSFPAVLSLLR